jgi:hypothetical protein
MQAAAYSGCSKTGKEFRITQIKKQGKGIILNNLIGGFHMANFKVVVSDPKEARAYQIDIKDV